MGAIARAAAPAELPAEHPAGPLVIGGTGGSGTRIVTWIVRRAGRFMGEDLNPFEDARDLARFDWSWGLEYVQARTRGNEGEVAARIAIHHDEALRRHLGPLGTRSQAPWGWKHPHSYLMLPFLRDRHPGLRFVHVVRDGRDMAFSSNQRQALHYGPAVFGASWRGPLPVRSAAYWAWANALALADGERLGERYLCLRYEDLCAAPELAVRRLLALSGGGPSDDDAMAELVAEVSPPASLGRWRNADPRLASAVTDAARAALRRFGYLHE